eukprot:12474323-Alexandrium_andersonii.AAC.1
MSASLVGSEMCIRDSRSRGRPGRLAPLGVGPRPSGGPPVFSMGPGPRGAVSYTHLTLPTICSV